MSESRPFIGRGRGRGNFNENAHVESRTFKASASGRDSWASGNSHQQDDWRSKPSSEADDWGVNDVPPVKRSHQDSNWKSSVDDDWNVGKVPDRPKPETKNNDWEDEWLKDDTPKPQQQASYQSATIQQSADTRIIRVANGRVGSVIGRGGSKIKELQDRSGARIKVLRDDDNGADTGVTITGSTEEQQLAENMIRDLTEEHTRSENDYPERRSGGSGFVPPGTIIVKVPSDCVGKIIGRGGSKIQDLQEKSGARIKVPRNDDGAYEVDVQISGDPDKQAAAEALIKELLNENPYSSNKASYSAAPAAMDEEDPTQIDWTVVIKNSIEATKARWAKAAPINKCFYIEEPEVALASRDDVEKFKLEHNNIMTSHYKKDDDRPIPNPVRKFSQAFVHYPEILQAVSSQGFSDPSPIQCQSWPILLKGYDMIGIAQTGTGKTLAFLLPALVHIESQPTPRDQRDGPTVLVMAPTRELAQQIEREVRKFPYKGITCVCVYGGGDRRQQMSTVAKGVEIVVATPGRLYDLMTAGALKTSSVSYVVLDEADRMLDLGFEPQIKKILIDVRPDRQTIMTSATWPEGIRRIANEYMDNPIQVCVGTLDLAAVHSITQHVEIIAEEDKRQRLMDFIKNLEKTDKAIVFVGRKLVADQIASELSLDGVVCQCIHGDRDQIDREQALADLRNGDVNLLIATDVASRGIDIKDITHILNYDFPRHAEEYVHRVGRTGRAGRSGIAISFMTREDWSKAPDLISILEEAGQEVPEELRTMSERYAAWKVRKDEERARDKLDSGRGGGGRGCHKCGQEGHFARECPTGGGFGGGRGGGSGGGRGCHKCGEEGHFARECPSGGGGGRGGGGGARRGYSGSSSSGPGPKRGSFGRDFF